MGSKKVIAIISILSIMLIMSVIGIVVVLVASNQNASSGVNVRYTSKNVSVKMSATAYVGDNKYVFKNGEATNLILSKANTSGSLSQTEDVLELTEDNPKIVFEYKFENLSSSKDAEIALNALPAKQSNVEVSYAFYDDKVNELDSLVTSENFDIQILPAYEKQIYRDRYLYIVVEVADLAQDAQFSGDFAWSVIDTVPTLVTLNNPSLAGTDEEVTYAKTLANNVFWEPVQTDSSKSLIYIVCMVLIRGKKTSIGMIGDGEHV